jgi:hypothetical protein
MKTQEHLFPLTDEVANGADPSRKFDRHVEICQNGEKVFLGTAGSDDFKGVAFLTRNDVRLLAHMFETGRFKSITG